MKRIVFLLFIGFCSHDGFAQKAKDWKIAQRDSSGMLTMKLKEIPIDESCENCNCNGKCQCFYKPAQFSSTEDILERAEGITLIKRGNFAPEPVIRGLSAGQINVTIDGMRIFSGCTDKMDPVTSYVEPNNLKSMQIDRGAMGFSSGSTVGGSLNMSLVEPQLKTKEDWSGAVGAGYQTISNGRNTLGNINFGSQRFAFRVNGVYRKNDDYFDGKGQEIMHSQYEKYNASFSAKYLLDENHQLKLDFISDESYNVGYPALPMDVAYAKAKIYALSYKNFRPSKWASMVEIKAYANTIDHKMDDTHRPDIPMHMDMPGFSHTFGGFVNADFKKVGKHTFSAKADYYHVRSRAEMTMYPENEASMFMLTWPDMVRHVGGLNLADKWQLNNKNSINFSGRLEYAHSSLKDSMGIHELEGLNYDVSKPDEDLLKNFGVTWAHQLSKNTTFSANAAYGERLPTVSEQYGFYIFNSYDGYDYIGDPDIKNEKSWQGTVSLSQEKKSYSITGEVFYYLMQDYILGVTEPDLSPITMRSNGVKTYQNIPSATLLGGELRILVKPFSRLMINSSTSYTFGNDNEGKPLPLIPPLKNITSARYEFNKISVQLEGEFAARQGRIDKSFGEDVTNGYAIANVRGTYKFKLKDDLLKISGGIENIMDNYYWGHLDWGNIPRPGRNFYINLKYTID